MLVQFSLSKLPKTMPHIRRQLADNRVLNSLIRTEPEHTRYAVTCRDEVIAFSMDSPMIRFRVPGLNAPKALWSTINWACLGSVTSELPAAPPLDNPIHTHRTSVVVDGGDVYEYRDGAVFLPDGFDPSRDSLSGRPVVLAGRDWTTQFTDHSVIQRFHIGGIECTLVIPESRVVLRVPDDGYDPVLSSVCPVYYEVLRRAGISDDFRLGPIKLDLPYDDGRLSNSWYWFDIRYSDDMRLGEVVGIGTRGSEIGIEDPKELARRFRVFEVDIRKALGSCRLSEEATAAYFSVRYISDAIIHDRSRPSDYSPPTLMTSLSFLQLGNRLAMPYRFAYPFAGALLTVSDSEFTR